MPAPRFHPFARLFYCALGLFAVMMVMALTLLLGGALATLWTGQNQDAHIAEIAMRYALPLTLLSYPASLLWISYCRTHFDLRSFVSLGLRKRRAFPDALRGFATGALAIGLLWFILWLTGAISVVGWAPDAFEDGIGRSALFLSGYALIFAAVGFFEELVFRGYTLHNLSNWLGWKSGVAIQATLFALIHMGNASSPEQLTATLRALPSLFLIAVFFALCYRKTGSLWFPIGFHGAWNFFLGCIFSLPVSGIGTFHLLDVKSNQNSWLSGGAFGAEGSFLLLPILVAMIYFISRTPDHPQALLDLDLLNRVVAVPSVASNEEPEDEESHENRFRTKFGTSQGFSADTLRELRELQEAREREQAEVAERARREALATSSFAPPVPILEVSAPEAVAPVVTASETAVSAAATSETPPAEAESSELPAPAPLPPAPPERPTPSPTIAELPKTTSHPAPSLHPPEEPPAKKKSAPRW